jgi:hypothetical protein
VSQFGPGPWLATPESATGGAVAMTKDATGVWSVTTPPLEATIHLYTVTVDGLTMADQRRRQRWRRFRYPVPATGRRSEGRQGF